FSHRHIVVHAWWGPRPVSFAMCARADGGSISYDAGYPRSLQGRRGFAMRPLLNLPCSDVATDKAGASSSSSSPVEAVSSPTSSFRTAYQLGKVLGVGSMSVVRIGTHRLDGRRIAVKCISSDDEVGKVQAVEHLITKCSRVGSGELLGRSSVRSARKNYEPKGSV
ncbi:unnamed protein product, partial [Polarella glacialis]